MGSRSLDGIYRVGGGSGGWFMVGGAVVPAWGAALALGAAMLGTGWRALQTCGTLFTTWKILSGGNR